MIQAIINQTRKTVVAEKVSVAATPLSRMRGLLGRDGLMPAEALVITRCNSIHMVFMKFPIDVIFVDREERVVGLQKNIKPFCFSPVFWNAESAIELSSGTISLSRTEIGDHLSFTSPSLF